MDSPRRFQFSLGTAFVGMLAAAGMVFLHVTAFSIILLPLDLLVGGCGLVFLAIVLPGKPPDDRPGLIAIFLALVGFGALALSFGLTAIFLVAK